MPTLRGEQFATLTAVLALGSIGLVVPANVHADVGAAILVPLSPSRISEAPPGGSKWDPTLPHIPSANVPGDPVAVANSVLQISQNSAEVTAQMGRAFLPSLGLNVGGDRAATTQRGSTAWV